MERANLVIADTDQEYVRMLMEYVRDTSWNGRLSAKFFTRHESFAQHLAHGPAAQLYLVRPDFIGTVSQEGYWIALAESQDEPMPTPVSLYKYQSLDRLLHSALDRLASAGQRHRSGAFSGNSAVVSVFSAVGGTGKTTVSLQLIRALTRAGRRCLLLNLETVCGGVFTPSVDRKDAAFARLLYYVRTGSTEAGEALSQATANASVSGVTVDVLSGSAALKEIAELSADDVHKLLGIIKTSGKYDTVLIDLESSSHSRIKGALSASDRIVWLLPDGSVGYSKSRQLLHACADWLETEPDKLHAKLLFAVSPNGSASVCDYASAGIGSAVRLPFIPAWDGTCWWELGGHEPLFEYPISQLVDKLALDGGVIRNDARNDLAYA